MIKSRLSAALLSACLTSGFIATAAQSAPMDLDTSFSTDGIVQASFSFNNGVPISGGNTYLHDVAVTPDGNILVIGNTSISGNESSLMVAKFKTDGTLDSSFADQGRLVLSDNITQLPTRGAAIAVQADGKIIIAGHDKPTVSQWRVLVGRLNADGTMDREFGNNGFYLANYNNPYGSANNSPVEGDVRLEDVALTKQGKILALIRHKVGGVSGNDLYVSHVIRLTDTGRMDSNFAGNDTALIAGDGNNGREFYNIAQNSSGDLFLSGSTANIQTGQALESMEIAQLNAIGNLPSSGSNSFWRRTTVPNSSFEELHGITVTDSDEIIAVGCENSSQSYVVKLNADGSQQNTFGNNTIARFDKLVGASRECLYDAIIHPAVGLIGVGGDINGQYVIAIDQNSGAEIGAQLFTGFSSGQMRSAAVLANGKIVAVGYSRADINSPYTGNLVMLQGSALAAQTVSVNALSFADNDTAAKNTRLTQAADMQLVITGANTIAAKVSGGEASTGPGSAFSDGTLNSGDLISLSHTSSPRDNASRTTALVLATGTGLRANNQAWNLGDTISTFTSTTTSVVTPPDTTVDTFVLMPSTLPSAVERNRQQFSLPVTISGLSDGVTVTASVSGGGNSQLSVNSGLFSANAVQVKNGDVLRVSHTSAASYATAVITTLSVGGVSADYSSITVANAPDTTPDAFDLGSDHSDVEPGKVFNDISFTVSGINAPASISIIQGEYSIDGGSFVRSAGSVNNGDNIRVRLTASDQYNSSVTTTLTIGGVSDSVVTITQVDPGTGGGSNNGSADSSAGGSSGGAWHWFGLLLLSTLSGWRRNKF